MRSQIIHISFAGPERVIVVNDKRIPFEDHRYCGPLPLTKQGDGKRLSWKHPFWEAVSQWYQAGKPMNADGTCHWEPEESAT